MLPSIGAGPARAGLLRSDASLSSQSRFKDDQVTVRRFRVSIRRRRHGVTLVAVVSLQEEKGPGLILFDFFA